VSKRLFGTDGIRAVAGESPLDPVTVRRFGASLASVVGRSLGRSPRIVLGRDTRESGPWLRDAVAAGILSRGARATDAGVVTTPGLARIVVAGGFDAGVMISASHNPFQDNGLKAFGADGMKLPDSIEQEIESLLLDTGLEDPGPRTAGLEEEPDLVGLYVRFLEQTLEGGTSLVGFRIGLDCANGAAAAIAPEVYRSYGAEVATIGVEPNGRNINLECGSLDTRALARLVREHRLDLGIAFDGDGDRALAVDSKGRLFDGDAILFASARRMNREGKLEGRQVVGTVMSNFWLEKKLGEQGIRLHRAPVGDKYVLEAMLALGASLGGEPSGHIIFRHRSLAGDGLLTGLLLLETLLGEGVRLEQLLDEIEPYPQKLLNVPVRSRPDLRSHPVIGPALAEIERALAGAGRVVVRYSGTEPVARVMVEGEDAEAVDRHARNLAELIRREIGA
jgi:phosphoglucosamine mutase